MGGGISLEQQRGKMDEFTNEPLFTNCTRDVIGTVDYIFYTGMYVWCLHVCLFEWDSSFAKMQHHEVFCFVLSWCAFDFIMAVADLLMVESLLELLDEDSLRKDTALPSPEWSSDHIALLAEFCCKPRLRRWLLVSNRIVFLNTRCLC